MTITCAFSTHPHLARATSAAVRPWSPVTTITRIPASLAIAHRFGDLGARRVEQRHQSEERQIGPHSAPPVRALPSEQLPASPRRARAARCRAPAVDRRAHRRLFLGTEHALPAVLPEHAIATAPAPPPGAPLPLTRELLRSRSSTVDHRSLSAGSKLNRCRLPPLPRPPVSDVLAERGCVAEQRDLGRVARAAPSVLSSSALLHAASRVAARAPDRRRLAIRPRRSIAPVRLPSRCARHVASGSRSACRSCPCR